ncbi:MAG: RNB domain-containing ribonuclease [Myxococcota bacterium]|nr:RNB domain-containing ribonuclease [Myxococcota bacterium]
MPSDRARLHEIAQLAMDERKLREAHSAVALTELEHAEEQASERDVELRDLRALLWSSVDNDDSRDLDQLSYAEAGENGAITAWVAIADVDRFVPLGSQLDREAAENTTTIYTEGGIFPMLPERLCTDLSSLNEGEDRVAMVAEMHFDAQVQLQSSDVYFAWVRNQARLAYSQVGDWLQRSSQGAAEKPPGHPCDRLPGLGETLRLQAELAMALQQQRRAKGALGLETVEWECVFEGERLVDLREEKRNAAKELIAELMIATNGVTARFLDENGRASMRRESRPPRRWERVVELARAHGVTLPEEVDGPALSRFVSEQRLRDPLRFPDLSLAIVKLLGGAEYTVDLPEQDAMGHFSLAVVDYTHSTAPNRRYPDLITQRCVKALLKGEPSPYSVEELWDLARQANRRKGDASKVERKVRKAAAAMVLSSHLGACYDAVVSGAAAKGTWVRVLHPPVEGRLLAGFEGLDVGDRVRVRLVLADVDQGLLDFERV